MVALSHQSALQAQLDAYHVLNSIMWQRFGYPIPFPVEEFWDRFYMLTGVRDFPETRLGWVPRVCVCMLLAGWSVRRSSTPLSAMLPVCHTACMPCCLWPCILLS